MIPVTCNRTPPPPPKAAKLPARVWVPADLSTSNPVAWTGWTGLAWASSFRPRSAHPGRQGRQTLTAWTYIHTCMHIHYRRWVWTAAVRSRHVVAGTQGGHEHVCDVCTYMYVGSCTARCAAEPILPNTHTHITHTHTLAKTGLKEWLRGRQPAGSRSGAVNLTCVCTSLSGGAAELTDWLSSAIVTAWPFPLPCRRSRAVVCRLSSVACRLSPVVCRLPTRHRASHAEDDEASREPLL